MSLFVDAGHHIFTLCARFLNPVLDTLGVINNLSEAIVFTKERSEIFRQGNKCLPMLDIIYSPCVQDT